MNIKDLTNLTIKNEQYCIEGNKVTCTLVCKANIKELEHQSFHFTDGFIHKVISQHLPVVKIIRRNCDEIMPYGMDVVAKYYLVPGQDAKVLYFDNNYFNEVRNRDNSDYKNRKVFNYNPGDMIPVGEVSGASCGMNEMSEYQYCDTFIVTGVAVCDSNDTFNEEIGKTLALSKAMLKANEKIGSIYFQVFNRANALCDLLKDSITELNNQNVKFIENLNM